MEGDNPSRDRVAGGRRSEIDKQMALIKLLLEEDLYRRR